MTTRPSTSGQGAGAPCRPTVDPGRARRKQIVAELMAAGTRTGSRPPPAAAATKPATRPLAPAPTKAAGAQASGVQVVAQKRVVTALG